MGKRTTSSGPVGRSPMKRRDSSGPHILGLVVDTAVKPFRDVAQGWLRYADERDDIETRYFFASAATTVENILEFVRSGVHALVLCGLQQDVMIGLVKSGKLDIPVVLLRASEPPPEVDLALFTNVGVVIFDNEAIGRHAGEFFMKHGIGNFGFLALDSAYTRVAGRVRSKAFRATMAADGGVRGVYSEKFLGVGKPNGDFWDEPCKELVSWVKSLPRPCGVFANDDWSALMLIKACLRLGIDIPGQIEVVSVNNNNGLCEFHAPMISSIQPDFDAGARMAMDMAIDIAVGDRPGAEDRVAILSSFAMVERGSSLSGRSYGKVVTRAREFIRMNACSGISVMDVAKHLGVSRRTLEVRMKYATGCSVLELIRKVRFDNICRLLETTNHSVSEIVTQSGYNLTGNVGAFFKRTYGMTMQQYRKVSRAE